MTSRRPDAEKLDSEESSVRPMSAFAGLGWTFMVTILMFVFMGIAVALREAAQYDLVTSAFAQLIAYFIGLFVILRIYAPDASIRKFIAFRPTAVVFYPLAILLGASLNIVTSFLFSLLLQRWPIAGWDEVSALFRSTSPLRQGVIILLAAGLIPMLEEVFFRGALFLPIRQFARRASLLQPWTRPATGDDGEEAARRPPAPVRSGTAWQTVVVVSILFVAAHLRWQQSLALMLPALALGFLRAGSGSLIPGVLFHMSFNGSNYAWEAMLGGPEADLPDWWVVVAGAVAAPLTVLSYFVARSSQAAAARAEEL